MVNPFPLSRDRRGGRANAHHNPMEPYRNDRVGLYRPRVAQRIPRCIPDALFNQVFAELGSHRDRALVALWVSTAARASELLGARCGDVDPGQQLVTVIRKGSRSIQQLPASPDAFVWLRLYQSEIDPEIPTGPDDPLWWTRRRPFRPLTYHAARAMFARASAALGANWTLHDLRHTAAYRMARDPALPLADVQWVLGHAHLSTTQLYLTPMPGDVIAGVLAHHRRRQPMAARRLSPPGRRHRCAQQLSAGIVGRVIRWAGARDRRLMRSGCDRRHGTVDRPGHAPALGTVPAPRPGDDLAGDRTAERTRAGPDARRFARSSTRRAAQQQRRLGMVRLLGWLSDQPGDTWQQRWEGQWGQRSGKRGLVATDAGLGVATQVSRRGVHVEQPSGLRAHAGLCRCDSSELGLDPQPAGTRRTWSR